MLLWNWETLASCYDLESDLVETPSEGRLGSEDRTTPCLDESDVCDTERSFFWDLEDDNHHKPENGAMCFNQLLVSKILEDAVDALHCDDESVFREIDIELPVSARRGRVRCVTANFTGIPFGIFAGATMGRQPGSPLEFLVDTFRSWFPSSRRGRAQRFNKMCNGPEAVVMGRRCHEDQFKGGQDHISLEISLGTRKFDLSEKLAELIKAPETLQSQRHICEQRILLSTSDISHLVESIDKGLDPSPSLIGGFGIVRTGLLKDGRRIAIKTLKLRHVGSKKKSQHFRNSKRFVNEISVWQKLKHRNVLPFLGTVELPDEGLPTSMVSPWVKNGNSMEFCKRNTSAPRLPILKGVIDGIAYLHSQSVVHGDIKGNNVLVGDDGTPLLCDFGLARICGTKSESVQGISTTVRDAGTVRYMALELHMSEFPGTDVSKASDMWAFGMFCVEILSGSVPYCHLKSDGQVIVRIHQGERPQRPCSEECSSGLWALIQRCWNRDPSLRISAEEFCLSVRESHLA
ncbi:kinase-like protein [Schizopora paradoxa]|uniref:Kinase-like protein n=1 Tax=Schizopora paradoxa TaxID=27342 RepID=A0A0H2R9G2_9AGAM|nr:kinase-like protein [Schizopora paradoxa]